MKASIKLTNTAGPATFTQLRQAVSRAIERGVDEAAGDALRVARSSARKRTKLLERSLGKKVKVYPSGNIVAVVGPRAGFATTLNAIAGGKLIGTQGKKGKAVALVAYRRSITRAIRIDPRFYAHLAGPGRRGDQQFMAPAAAALKQAAPAAIAKEIAEVAR